MVRNSTSIRYPTLTVYPVVRRDLTPISSKFLTTDPVQPGTLLSGKLSRQKAGCLQLNPSWARVLRGSGANSDRFFKERGVDDREGVKKVVEKGC